MKRCAACGERAYLRVPKRLGIFWACMGCFNIALENPNRFLGGVDEWERIMRGVRREVAHS